MGDSEYVIYRPTTKGIEEIYHSEGLQHEFNLPYQVGTYGDDPCKVICKSHALYPGDIILAATDGLWDNLEADYIKGVTETYLKEEIDGRKLNELSVLLGKEAYKKSLNK